MNTLLEKWRQGDRAAAEQIATLVYAEMRRLAGYFFRHESPGHTLQPTALVNEVFLKMSSGIDLPIKDRAHFFALAAKQMRRILIDHARRRAALKRHDSRILLPIDAAGSEPRVENILVVEEALHELELLDSRAARVVELRVFGGLKEREIADALEISPATVKRDWTFAKAWLTSRLSPPVSGA